MQRASVTCPRPLGRETPWITDSLNLSSQRAGTTVCELLNIASQGSLEWEACRKGSILGSGDEAWEWILHNPGASKAHLVLSR